MDTIKHGIDTDNIDAGADLHRSFYDYAAGGWIKSHPLPPEYARFGMFDLLRDNAQEQLKALVTGLSDNPDSKVPGSVAQKVSDLYAMGMDEERLNREKATPIMPLVEKINSFKREEFTDLLVMNHLIEGGTFFGTGVGADAKDSDINIMYIGEMGLGLGDRDFYIEDTDDNRRILEAYEKYVKRLMELIGYDEAACERVWQNVIKIETEAARHKMTREDRRNPRLRYNMHTIEEIKERYPAIDWESYFKGLGVPCPEKANVSSVGYMQFMTRWLPELEWQAILDYMVFDTVSGGSGLLSDDFRDANFEMFGRVMSGQEEQKPRWKRAMAIPNSMLGEAVGELYVARHFQEDKKQTMLRIVENLRSSLGDLIGDLPWMCDDTKARALEKLRKMTVKIGYPDKWKDYSEIVIDPKKSYFENVVEASKWYIRDNYSKLNKPVDKTEWHMTPQTVNAYYSPSTNEICFPAAILQPPYFDMDADDAVNYGAIGAIIGHEMTHGFDDQGRQFDSDGNLNNWWSESDEKSFNMLADKLAAQFDKIEVAPGTFANGRYTLGENIADQGGLRVAMNAYRKSLGTGTPQMKDFYLSYAALWAENIRPEEVMLRVKTDPHSLGRHRVDATLRNIDEFNDAFGISEGDGMYLPKEERVIIW